MSLGIRDSGNVGVMFAQKKKLKRKEKGSADDEEEEMRRGKLDGKRGRQKR